MDDAEVQTVKKFWPGFILFACLGAVIGLHIAGIGAAIVCAALGAMICLVALKVLGAVFSFGQSQGGVIVGFIILAALVLGITFALVKLWGVGKI